MVLLLLLVVVVAGASSLVIVDMIDNFVSGCFVLCLSLQFPGQTSEHTACVGNQRKLSTN